jgi:peptide chain release factor subunit 1
MTQLQNLLKLKQLKGVGLVSMIIPARLQIYSITNNISTELSTASRIKNKSNRDSIINTYKDINEFFVNITHIPLNGVAVFAGTYVDKNGVRQREILNFTPPKPIKEFIYSCDEHFHVDFIEDLYKTNV